LEPKVVIPVDSIRFGADFEFDVRAYQLRSGGIPIKLSRTQMELLRLLIERRGELVSREEIVERIWPPGVFVDTDNSINAAISRIRQVLRDDAEDPQFVETVVGRGYRFIAPVSEGLPETSAAPGSDGWSKDQDRPDQLPPPVDAPSERLPESRLWYYAAIALALCAAVAISVWSLRKRTPPASEGRVMVAVLPFKNLTGDVTQEYFSDGLTEEMLTQLGRMDPQHLGIIARTSVMRYKENPKPIDRIGTELGVQYILEGSVRRNANRVRISAQLIQVKDQTHLWAEEYDRDVQDILVVQSEISRTIADEIAVALGQHKSAAPIKGEPRQDYEAYDLYLKGQYFWNKRTVEDLERSIDYFQQAVDKQPNYAQAQAGLARAYVLLGGYQGTPQGEYIAKARAAALRAIKLDERLPEAHAALALIVQNYDWDWKTAEKEFREAIQLDPNYATAHHWYAEHLALQGRFEEALSESESARQLDPMSLIIASDRGVILYYSRQYDLSIAQFRAVQEMDPNFGRASMIFWPHVQKGMTAEAVSECERARATGGDSYPIWSRLAYAYGRSGHLTEARAAQRNAVDFTRKHAVDAGLLATAFIGTGETDQALAWLEKACRQHSNVVTTLKVDPLFDPLRNDPRFVELLRQVGLN
jgi:TolB-like protein/DNA-binding winged helix-turn-helix (wHTH) protein/Tfp pilus assembly protein PilF